jgi:hypothetical protein
LKQKTSIHDFERAIKREYGCLSALHSRRVVNELFQEHSWQGEVLTFDLLNHATAARCYAWAVDGEVTVMLHDGPVDSPRTAVRSFVEAEHSQEP